MYSNGNARAMHSNGNVKETLKVMVKTKCDTDNSSSKVERLADYTKSTSIVRFRLNQASRLKVKEIPHKDPYSLRLTVIMKDKRVDKLNESGDCGKY